MGYTGLHWICVIIVCLRIEEVLATSTSTISVHDEEAREGEDLTLPGRSSEDTAWFRQMAEDTADQRIVAYDKNNPSFNSPVFFKSDWPGNRRVTFGPDTGSLTIHNVQIGDEGTFVNWIEQGNHTAYYKVTVLVYPTNLAILGLSQPTPVNNTVKLICIVQRSKPRPDEISWMLDGKLLSNENSTPLEKPNGDGTYYVTNTLEFTATDLYDQTNFACVVALEELVFITNGTLDIGEDVQTIEGFEGEDVTLPCRDNEPYTNVDWFRGRELETSHIIARYINTDTSSILSHSQLRYPFNPGTGSLMVKRLTLKDGMWYTCTPVSGVYYRHLFVNVRPVTIHIQEDTMVTGDYPYYRVFTCVIDRVKPGVDSITWYLNGTKDLAQLAGDISSTMSEDGVMKQILTLVLDIEKAVANSKLSCHVKAFGKIYITEKILEEFVVQVMPGASNRGLIVGMVFLVIFLVLAIAVAIFLAIVFMRRRKYKGYVALAIH